MKRILDLYDRYALKILVAFLILFVALYPKLPSIHIIRTWVYIRLEDFFILGTSILWFIQLIRRKVSLPWPFVYAIGGFWLIGLASTVYSVLFIGPHISNFFSHLAFLEYARRVEYMVLFFVAFSTIRSAKDLRDYFIVLAITLLGVFLYGLGQHYYLYAWDAFPKFFEKFSFCFPSFQTGNEEFAKGTPLCLPKDARITSTFGGNYDLSAYLVIVLPIFIGVFISLKKWSLKIGTLLLFIAGLMVLLFTASRTSFMAYLIGAVIMLILYRKKLFIIPVVLISFLLLVTFSGSTAKRLMSTFRIASVVTNNQGQLVGELPQNLQDKISTDKFISPPPAQNLQTGSAIIGLPSTTTPVATNVAQVKKTLTPEEAKRLQLASGTLEISTVSGSFLVKKALVYDISFTTRFQAEWPNAWNAFLRNVLLGSGYSSITLATDGDYFRALGETGLLGLLSFVLIFIVFGITLKETVPRGTTSFTHGFAFGLTGGVIALALNAVLIDVFESSKVAETLWLLLGIGAGSLLLSHKKPLPYLSDIKRIIFSPAMIIIYFIVLICWAFLPSVSNFFVGDDFVWLHWAASSTTSDIAKYFTNSQNFFYRPLDKTVIFYLYSIFSFLPQGYHVVLLILHLLGVIGVYYFVSQITKKKFLSFAVAVLFALHPAHAENLLWFSSLSSLMGSIAILYAAISFLYFRKKKSAISYTLAVIFSIIAFLSYEIAIAVPFVFLTIDIFLVRPKNKIRAAFSYLPFVLLWPAYGIVRIMTHAFSGGGDYSYSITHFVPNMVGNFFGYTGLFLGGEQFLPIYNTLRSGLRTEMFLFALAFLAAFVTIAVVVYSFRKFLVQALQTQNAKHILFGIVFAFVALLPFLALGNIAERYLYLASVGFCLSFVLIINSLIKIFSSRDLKKQMVIFVVVVVILSGWYQLQNVKEQHDWGHAGNIAMQTLAEFRIDYENLPSGTHIYFVNTPIKYGNAWVFPVGLTDGMWFIYREGLPSIYQVQTLDQAKAAVVDPKKDLIFQFDTNGKLIRVKL